MIQTDFFTIPRRFFLSISSIILLIIGSINESKAQRTYSYHFDPADFWIYTSFEGDHYIQTSDGLCLFGSPDELCIPTRCVRYAIPFGTTATKVTVTMSEKKLFQENIVLANNPDYGYPGITTTPELSENLIGSVVNTSYTTTDDSPVTQEGIVPMTKIGLCPFIYEEDTHNLYFIEDFTISIELGEKYSFTTKYPDETKLVSQITFMVENKEEVPAIVHEAEVKRGLEDIKYCPLFTDGKEWTMCHYAATPRMDGEVYYTTHDFIYVKCDGSKEIDGIKCKRLAIDVEDLGGFCNGCYSWLSEGLKYDSQYSKYDFYTGIQKEIYVYEKDRKIYFYRNPGIRFKSDTYGVEQCEPYFELLMDLNVSVGDSGIGLGTIATDDLVEIDGELHRRIAPKYSTDTPEWDKQEWIEGIGAAMGLNGLVRYDQYMFDPMTELKSPRFELTQVKDNGKVIYDRSERLKEMGLNIVTGVEEIVTDCEAGEATYFNLHGVRVNNPSHGIYVKVANGKASKVVIR